MHRYITYTSRMFHRVFFVFYNIGVFYWFLNVFHCISVYYPGSEALLCGSELNLFLAGGLTHDCAMSVRWEPEHKITLLVSTARFVACQTKPVLCPRAWEATSKPYVRSRVGAFGLADHSMVSIHGWRHGQPTKKLQLCFARTVWRWLSRLVDRS